eukprot:TRINITY_DN7400_c0_g1_i1.p1 TRINITY_DN7400_c0_g1~~TRINITY_DN7400_c0_g1_i1.p1  ORF type:complete len:1074 (+),score=215.58 TRINITY_DN7400_c0_g1_i1:1060-4281(+)
MHVRFSFAILLSFSLGKGRALPTHQRRSGLGNLNSLLTCPSNQTISSNGTSAIATWIAPSLAGFVTTCTPPIGSSFAAGLNSVTCVAVQGLLSENCSFSVYIQTPPFFLNCPLAPLSTTNGLLNDDDKPQARDQDGSYVDVSCNPPFNQAFNLNETTTICTATDARGLSSTCEVSVVTATLNNSTGGLLGGITLPNLTSTCGNSICEAVGESCTSCTVDCGPCSGNTIPEIGALGPIAAQFSQQVIGVGAALLYVTAPANPQMAGEQASLTVLTELSEPVAALAAQSAMINGASFLGVAFKIESNQPTPSQEISPIETCFNVTLDMQSLGVSILDDSSVSLRSFDVTTASWPLIVTFSPEGMVYTAFTCTRNTPMFVFGSAAPAANPIQGYLETTNQLITSKLQPLASNIVAANVTEIIDAVDAGVAALDQLTSDVGASLGLEPVPFVLASNNITITILKFNISQINALPSQLGDFTLPASLIDTLSSLLEEVFFICAVSYDFNIFTWGANSDAIKSGVRDISLKSGLSLQRIPLSLPDDGVRTTFDYNAADYPGASDAVARQDRRREDNRRYSAPECQRWNDDVQSNDNCTQGQADCQGDWTGDNVTTSSRNDTQVECEMTSFSDNPRDGVAFAIDFTLVRPRVNAANFDIREAYVLYAVYLGFATILALLYWYAHSEYKHYRQYQESIRDGLQEPVLEDEAEEIDTDASKLTQFWQRIRLFFKTRHVWIKLVWRRDFKTRPKRAQLVGTFAVTVIVGFAVASIFYYAAHRNVEDAEVLINACIDEGNSTVAECEELHAAEPINSVVIGDMVVPLTSVYTFILMLPGYFLMTLSYHIYDTALDLLEIVDPETYGNYAFAHLLKTGNGSSQITSQPVANKRRNDDSKVRPPYMEVLHTDDLGAAEEDKQRIVETSITTSVDTTAVELDITEVLTEEQRLAVVKEAHGRMVFWGRFITVWYTLLLLGSLCISLVFLGSLSPTEQFDWFISVLVANAILGFISSPLETFAEAAQETFCVFGKPKNPATELLAESLKKRADPKELQHKATKALESIVKRGAGAFALVNLPIICCCN